MNTATNFYLGRNHTDYATKKEEKVEREREKK